MTAREVGARSMWARMQTWWTILRISLDERLVYRGDFALGTLMRFLPIVTQIFLWTAVFKSVSGGRVAGYSLPDFIAYYLLTMVARAFSSMPGLASQIAGQIRSGDIKKYLTQPIDLLGFMLLSRIAHKIAYYMIATGPFVLVFFLCRGYFSAAPSDIVTWGAFLLSLVLCFLLGFFLEASMGLVGFWFLEVSSILFVYMLFSFFLSGHMFPLDMIGEPWRQLVMYSPLAFLAYFPAAIFLGKVTGYGLLLGLLAQAFWVLFFIGLSRVLLARGLRRYGGYGG